MDQSADAAVSTRALAELPSVVAIPLREYLPESYPVMRLHRLCDAVEVLTRFCAIVALGELRVRLGDKPLPQELLRVLQPQIERPTFAQWKNMLRAILDSQDRGTPLVVPELREFIGAELLPSLPGGDAPPEGCLISLRNRIVHGGAVTRAEAQYLLQGNAANSQGKPMSTFAGWQPWLERLVTRLDFLAQCDLCFFQDQQARPLLGAGQLGDAVPLSADLKRALKELEGHVVLLRAGRWVDLWPLCGYGRATTMTLEGPRQASTDSPLIFMRAERSRLLYAALGVDLPLGERADVVEQFRSLFQLASRVPRTEAEADPGDFDEEVRRDAQLRVGREEELKHAVDLVKQAQRGVFWLYGPGGIGKSFLTAAIAESRSLSGDPKKLCRIIWRFKASDQSRCNRVAFFRHAIERIAAWLGNAVPERTGDADGLRKELERVLNHVAESTAPSEHRQARAARVIFILDGLDEIVRSDASFAHVVFQLERENVIWLCAGREENNLERVFSEPRSRHVFPGGLPAMGKDDVRAMLVEGSGSLKYKLLELDEQPESAHSSEEVENRAIEAIVARAEGLPLYVHYVLEDIRSGHFHYAELTERLPPSLSAYYDDLLRRLSIADLHALLTPLVVTIAWAEAPLEEETLYWLMVQREVITDSAAGRDMLRKGLDAVRSMVREAAAVGGGIGYEPYHPTFGDHIRAGGPAGSEGRHSLDQQNELAQKKFCVLASAWSAFEANHPARLYALRFGPQHLTDSKRWDELERLLTDIFFLEAKTQAGLVFDLARDFSWAVHALEAELRLEQRKASLSKCRILRLVGQALRREIHFIDRHREDYPQGLFQCLWNNAWWYDCPQAALHYVSDEPPGGDPDEPLSRLLEKWKEQKEQATPGFQWLRTHRPPAVHLGTAQLAVLRGHERGITSVAVDAACGRIVSGSCDDTVRVWDAESGAELAILRGHEDWVSSVAVDAVRGRIVSGSDDKTVRVWDAESGDQLAVLRGHDYQVTSTAVDADRCRIVSGSRDATVRVWDIESGAQLAVLRGHEWRIWSVAVDVARGRIVSGGDDKMVRVWDAESGDQLAVLRGHDDSVNSIAVDATRGRIISGSSDATVRVWDAESGAELAVLRGHEEEVRSVAVDVARGRIVSGSDDKTVRVWDAESGDQLAVLLGHKDDVWSVAVDVARGRIVSGGDDKMVRVWDAESGDQLAVLRGHKDWVSSMALDAARGRIVSGSEDRTVRVWDIESGAQLAVLRGHEWLVWSVAVDVARGRIVSGSADHTVRVWDAESGDQLAVLRGHDLTVKSVAVDAARGRIVSGSADHTVRVWDAESGEHLAVLRGHDDSVDSIAVDTTRGRIISGSADHTVRVWDIESGAELAVLRGHTLAVRSVAVDAAHSRIFSGSSDGTMRVWDAERFQYLEMYSGVEDIAIFTSAVGAYCAIRRDEEVLVEEIGSGNVVARLPAALRHITAGPRGLTWSGSYRNDVCIFTLERSG